MFVDVHSHVVPSGDDGAATEGEGLELCRGAAATGTRVLFATPHVWPHLPLTPERERAVRAAHAAMAPRAAAAGLDLRLGFELTPAPALLEEDPRRYRLGDAPAVLMELPFAGPLGLALRVATEIAEAGLTPIIGHPERAEAVQEDETVVDELVERGWPLQVNATSLLGRHGRGPHNLGWRLVRERLAGLVASDGHRTTRPPRLDNAYAAVRAEIGETADALFDGSALPELDVPRESAPVAYDAS